jgi:trk system potassium uptake protein TrkA
MDVENIVNVEQQMGIMLANRLVSPDIETVVPLATGHSIAQVRVPRTWVGKTLRELDLRRRSRVNVVAIKRMVPDVDDQGERFMRYDVNDVPTPDDTLREADVMVVVGANEDIRNLTQE